MLKIKGKMLLGVGSIDILLTDILCKLLSQQVERIWFFQLHKMTFNKFSGSWYVSMNSRYRNYTSLILTFFNILLCNKHSSQLLYLFWAFPWSLVHARLWRPMHRLYILKSSELHECLNSEVWIVFNNNTFFALESCCVNFLGNLYLN